MTVKNEGNNLVLKSCTISPPLALAPMVGLSHSALRLLVVELGGAGLFFSEMLSVGKLPSENERISPYLSRTAAESPLFYQIFAGTGQDVLPAIERLHTLNAQGIDLNLGCPAPALRKLGAGSFMKDQLVVDTVRKIRSTTTLPLSAKIRLGKTLDEKSLVSFCKMLEDEGIDLLTVHGRLHGEKFCRKVRWDWIAKVKKAVKIPVIANGGIFSVADAKKCLDESCADGLMIGRGAAIRPWIFAEIASELYGVKVPDRPPLSAIYFRFVALLEARFQPERRLGRLKQFTHYYADNFAFGHHLASGVQNANSIEEASATARGFFEKSEK
jgi:tRNA-dihydrouridine synthase B